MLERSPSSEISPSSVSQEEATAAYGTQSDWRKSKPCPFDSRRRSTGMATPSPHGRSGSRSHDSSSLAQDSSKTKDPKASATSDGGK